MRREEKPEHDYYQLSSTDYLFIRTQAGQQPTLSGEEGGERRGEVLSWDKDTTLNHTEIINWLAGQVWVGERREERTGCPDVDEIRCCLVRTVNTSPIKSDIRIRPASHLAELTKNIFHQDIANIQVNIVVLREEREDLVIIIWKILMSYF